MWFSKWKGVVIFSQLSSNIASDLCHHSQSMQHWYADSAATVLDFIMKSENPCIWAVGVFSNLSLLDQMKGTTYQCHHSFEIVFIVQDSFTDIIVAG